MIHETKIKKYSGNLLGIAEDIGNLRYDTLAEFIGLLSQKLKNDSIKDAVNGRVKLSKKLEEPSTFLEDSKENILKAL